MGNWTLDDIPWERFDGGKVDPEILRIVKAASLVEQNGGDYAVYLCNVFADDADFQAAARRWGAEEIQHGQALGRQISAQMRIEELVVAELVGGDALADRLEHRLI